jgi:hypothetical protein
MSNVPPGPTRPGGCLLRRVQSLLRNNSNRRALIAQPNQRRLALPQTEDPERKLGAPRENLPGRSDSPNAVEQEDARGASQRAWF